MPHVKAKPPSRSDTIVTGDWLQDRLQDPAVRIIEVCSLADQAPYLQGHIPGAAWWFWKDKCWHDSNRDFVTPEEAARNLGALGIAPETTLVFYGDPVQYGPYAAWTYTMAGHADVRILDGGRAKWLSDGRPLTDHIPEFSASTYEPQEPDSTSRIGRDGVRAKLDDPNCVLLDVRSPEEYRGERVMPPPNFDHGAERTGRIPGAIHLHYQDLLNEDDTYLAPDALAAKFAAIGLTPDAPVEIIAYCRLSHRATLTWFAMTHILGFKNVKIYDGSWTEWGSIVGFPVEK